MKIRSRRLVKRECLDPSTRGNEMVVVEVPQVRKLVSGGIIGPHYLLKANVMCARTINIYCIVIFNVTSSYLCSSTVMSCYRATV